jgi:acyl transferase domain-containing protein/NAD(P)-dependent dehydrogenase (short-subunit alcohol dehydrogenase family)/acyl carrier protein
VGLLELLRLWGIEPDAVLGHSVGEIAAAYAAGALSLEQAVRVVAERSRAQAATVGLGRMAAVGLSAQQAQTLLSEYSGLVSLAAVNSPCSVTLSGDPKALQEIGEELAGRNVFFRLLPLEYAFHSPVMDGIRDDLLAALAGLTAAPTRLPLISTVTGTVLAGERLGADYWWDNVRRPVLFGEAVQGLIRQGITTFLEVGPHPVLRSYIAECLEAEKSRGHVLATLRRKEPEQAGLLALVGRCHTLGAPLRLEMLVEPQSQFVSLPHYPWQRERQWNGMEEDGAKHEHPLLGCRRPGVDATWDLRLNRQLFPYLPDHCVQGAVVFPAAGFLEMALAAVRLLGVEGPCVIESLDIRKALVLPDGQSPFVQTVFQEEDSTFRIASRAKADGPWVLHTLGKWSVQAVPRPSGPTDLEALRRRCPREVSPAEFYRLAHSCGLEYGPAFRGVAGVWVGEGEAFGRIVSPPQLLAELDGYRFHPSVLDACIQVAGLSSELASGRSPARRLALLPIRVEALHFHRPATASLSCHARIERRDERSQVVNFTVFDDQGEVCCEVEGLRLQGVELSHRDHGPGWLYEYQWQRQGARGQEPGAGEVLPGPELLAARLAGRFDALACELDRPAYYQQLLPRLDELCSAYAFEALRDLNKLREGPASGGRDELPPCLTAEALLAHGLVAPAHRRLQDRLLRMLAEDGFLEPRGNGWTFTERRPADAGQLWRELYQAFPPYHAELLLLGRCGTNLAGVLRGQVNALELIFPARGIDVAQHLYDSAPFHRIYNLILQEAVAELVRSLPPNRSLRILELGAGTGGTTAFLLPLLPPERIEYVFTDVSEAFLTRAEQRFAAFPFVKYTLLDVEKPIPQERQHAYDLVIAANVLHATADLRRVLDHVCQLLASSGLLLLVEKQPDRPSDVIFGLLSGWWRFEDTDLRPDSALLPPAMWRDVLGQKGFVETATLSDRVDGGVPQQAVVFARGPSGLGSPDRVPQVPREAESWLLLAADTAGLPPAAAQLQEEVARMLKEAGERVVTVTPGAEFTRRGERDYQVNPTRTDDFLALLRALEEDAVPFGEVLHLWNLGLMASHECEPEDHLPRAALEASCLGVAMFVQALSQVKRGHAPRLRLVTIGSQLLPGQSNPISPVQAPLWGLGRVMANEHPELRCQRIDLQWDGTEEEAAGLTRRLLSELLAAGGEDELLLLPEAIFVNRLAPATLEVAGPVPSRPASADGPTGYRLETAAPGSLDQLRVVETERRVPAQGEVEIEVHAAGLNFKDVMLAMGMLSGEAVENGFAGSRLGLECAGEVVRVGPGVSDLRVGDRVLTFARNCFASHVTANAPLTARLPAGVGFEEAATVPTAFLTAYYALEHLARLEQGERVLIHGAAGGVGLAAIQLARLRGAEIFATAGSPEKHDLLRMLGVPHILSSRSLEFVEEVRRRTAGRGVDIVLNSLAGPFLRRSLDLLRPFGRFLEIGKRDLVADSKIGLRPFRNNVSYFGIDVDQLVKEKPDLAVRMMREVMELFHQGKITPLPYRTYPLGRAVEAFRQMQHSRHVGKIVLAPRASPVPVTPRPRTEWICRADGTYLITGGLGGFGLATAQRLVERGGRHLVLVGRKGAATEEARSAVARLEAAGAVVRVEAADVSDETQVRDLLARLRRDLPPLRGVLHAAMVLDDRAILRLDSDSWSRVLGPKVFGAWHLHRLTRDDPLELFVMFSSVSALVGNAGQGNYVAANLYLEALAQARQQAGLPAVAVGWGAIADAGYLARNRETLDSVAGRLGVKPLPVSQALDTLERLMLADRPLTAVADLDWSRWSAVAPSAAAPRFSRVRASKDEKAGLAGSWQAFRKHLLDSPAGQRRPLVLARLTEILGKILGLAARKVDTAKSVSDLGLDSLMAVELRVLLEKEVGLDLPVMELMQGKSVEDLAVLVLAQLGPAAADGPDLPARANGVPSRNGRHADAGGLPAGARVDPTQLSDAEVDSLLIHLLSEETGQPVPSTSA